LAAVPKNGTPTAFVVGDRVVFYAGGSRAGGKSFHAVATVSDKIASNRAVSHRIRGLEGNAPAVEWLQLTDTHRFDPCIPMAGLIAQLSIIPKNRIRWGVAMMGGVRKIHDVDLDCILSYQADAQRDG
jgi:hypothetical protein